MVDFQAQDPLAAYRKKPAAGGLDAPAGPPSPFLQPPTGTPATTPTPNIAPGMPVPPPNIAPGMPSQPFGGTPTQAFGPGQNLIGTQFNPGADPRLGGTQGQVTGLQNQLAAGGGQIPGQDQAQGLLNQAGQTIGTVGGFGQDTGQVRQSLTDLLGGLNSAPDRQTLALQSYDTLAKAGEPGYQEDLRRLGQSEAALGRLGSGQTRTGLQDLFGKRQTELATIRANLANQAAGQTLSDQLAKVGAAGGVLGQLGGLDTSQAGLGLQKGGALAGLAGQQFGFGQGQLGAQQGVLGQLAGLEGQQYNQNLGNIGVGQQERAYQYGLDQNAVDRGVQQRLLEDQLLNSDYGRQANTLGLIGGYGFQNPSPTGLAISNQYSGQAGDTQAAIAELLKTLGGGRSPTVTGPYGG